MCTSSRWKMIPGYEGLYWINSRGLVVNSSGHILRAFTSKAGATVELRKFGQREKVLIAELLKQAYQGTGEVTYEDN